MDTNILINKPFHFLLLKLYFTVASLQVCGELLSATLKAAGDGYNGRRLGGRRENTQVIFCCYFRTLRIFSSDLGAQLNIKRN